MSNAENDESRAENHREFRPMAVRRGCNSVEKQRLIVFSPPAFTLSSATEGRIAAGEQNSLVFAAGHA